MSLNCSALGHVVGIQSVPIFFLSFFFLTSYPCLEPSAGGHRHTLSPVALWVPPSLSCEGTIWVVLTAFTSCTNPHPSAGPLLCLIWESWLHGCARFVKNLRCTLIICVFSACSRTLSLHKKDLEIYCRWRDSNIVSCWPMAPNWHQEGTGSYYLGSGHHPSNLLPPYTDVFF